MYASDDCGAAILSAAHRARTLAVRLFSTPNDPTLIEPFFETAMTIEEVGQKLGIDELSDLSVRLVAAAKQEILSDAGPAQLDCVLTRLAVIAEKFGQQKSAQMNSQKTQREFERSTSRLGSIYHPWTRKP